MTSDQIDELMRDNGIVVVGKAVYALVQLVIAIEREECAKVCEDIDTEYEGKDVLATWCATAIRARGNT